MWTWWLRARLLIGLGAMLAAVAGCEVPAVGNLDDGEANRVVVALDRANVGVSKEADPANEGKWRVDVPRADLARALTILRDEELPRRTPPGVLEAVSKGSLVPSEASEHAELIAGMAGDLERSLEGIEGVLGARVHLSVPMFAPLRDGPIVRSSASVLLEHRGSTPPLAADAVQRLVAGGVAGMLPADVSVVMVSRSSPALAGTSDLGHIGPITVARSSLRDLQAALVALVALVALLAGSTLLLYSRLSRLRAELATRDEVARPAH